MSPRPSLPRLDIEARFHQVAAQLGDHVPTRAGQVEALPRRALTETIARLFDFPSLDAVRKWARDHGIVGWRRGRYLLYDPRDFEASFEAEHRPMLRRVK